MKAQAVVLQLSQVTKRADLLHESAGYTAMITAFVQVCRLST
jgi:hypothetical protein